MSCICKIFSNSKVFVPEKEEKRETGKHTHVPSYTINEEAPTPPQRISDGSDVSKTPTDDSGITNESTSPRGSKPDDVINPPSIKNHRKEGVIFNRSSSDEQKVSVYNKDERTRNLIRRAIENNDFLNNYMDDERKEHVINAMEPAIYNKGSYIIRENDTGSEIYVSEDGFIDIIKGDAIIDTLGSGVVFGELAILYNAKRFASVKAATKVKVWKINRSKFRSIMLFSGNKEKEENLNFLKSVPELKQLSDEVLLMVVDLLKRKFYPTHTAIVKQGDIGNEFFIIRGGTVTVKKRDKNDVEKIAAHLKRGQFFGEQAILNEKKQIRTASVYADTPGTECLKLDGESFKSYFGSIEEISRRPQDVVDLQPSSGRVSGASLDNQYNHVEIADLKKVATLGAGAFGRVDLVQHTSGETFALKVVKKIDIIKQDQKDHVYSEKQVMSICHNCPFIIELYKTFKDRKYVYFLMELCLGGDVFAVMSQRKYFDERTAKFLVACVVQAFEFLHSRNIVYRDLKPENLMLTPDGYCKLVDFGFAKYLSPNYKTNTFAGTPEYVAPEIILDRGHDRAADYWTLGILVHELLVGKTPFRGQNQMKIYQQILGGIDAVKMPAKIPKIPQTLIKHLCKQTPAERLGYQKRGIVDIKKHSWFDGFDWGRLELRKMKSPIPRPVNSNTDLKYFNPCADDNDNPPDETSGWDRDF